MLSGIRSGPRAWIRRVLRAHLRGSAWAAYVASVSRAVDVLRWVGFGPFRANYSFAGILSDPYRERRGGIDGDRLALDFDLPAQAALDA